MRRNHIVAVGIIILAVVAIWGLATIANPPHPQNLNAAPALASINAMQMMKNARNLPVEQSDAP